jgi:hypothetical protein
VIAKKADRSIAAARSFGRTFAALSALIAAQRWWRGHITVALILLAVGVALLAVSVVRPALLDRPNRIWMRAARAVGWVNSHVLLTLMFVLIITPYGAVQRLFGRDVIGRRWRAEPPHWTPAPDRLRNHNHYDHLY